MSLFANYVKEFRGDDIVETEHGFATYRYTKDGNIYIVDLYVLPEHRKSNKAGALADYIVGQAKLRGCKKLLGTVVPYANNSTTSVKVLLGYGMKLQSSTPDLIIFEKDING